MIRAVDNERTRIERDAKERVADLLANVDRQIISIQAELSVLAVSPSLQSGDFAAFDRQMRDALKIQGTSIVLHDLKGMAPYLPLQPLEQTDHGEQHPKPHYRQGDPNDDLPRPIVLPRVAAEVLRLDFAVPFSDVALRVGLHPSFPALS